VRIKKLIAAGAAIMAVTASLTGCSGSSSSSGSSASGGSSAASSTAKINVVGAENEYSDVAAQIGGQYVTASAIMSDPNTDPHTFEASPSVAKELSKAQLVIQNGVGYDDFMAKLEKASPNNNRTVIDAQQVLGLPDNTPNPHLWYDPKTMPAVAKQIAADLGKIQPAHESYFQSQLTTFDKSLSHLDRPDRRLQEGPSEHPGRGDRTRRGLHAPGGRNRHQDAVVPPGRNHE
jgi:zinc/manganese transport system substrate-binding protein